MKNGSKQTRPALTDKELRMLTVADLARLKLTLDEKTRLRELNSEREAARRIRAATLRIEEAPILDDLREIGIDVGSVWDLVNRSDPYPKAIGVLLKHLLLPYQDRTREGIARALAVPEPEVINAWPLLLDQYRSAPVGKGIKAPGETELFDLGAKDGLACALSVAVTDSTLKQMIELLKDRKQGSSRILLLSSLRNTKNPLALQALQELVFDPELAEEILSWGTVAAPTSS
jgi:hypothetical protein